MREPSVSKYDLMKFTSIVTCIPEDLSELRELHKAAITSTGWRFYSLAEVAAKLKQIDEPDYTITLLNENVLLARMNNFLVGTSSWRPSTDHPQTAIISHLYVHPLFTNGGIATALIEENEQAAYVSGFRWISAEADFNSRTFYSRLGYESKGFDGCKEDQSVHYPVQIMTRHISSQYNDAAHKKANTDKPPLHEPVIID